jgi:YHYH protein/Secretion system C-terminal sorting domain
MKKLNLLSVALVLIAINTFAQGPTITSWIRNTTGATGYNSIPSNVQVVQYTGTDVYVSSTSIPDYTIGPWQSNPNTPTNQNFVTKFTRIPQQNTGNQTNTPLGNMGMWSNGVAIYNPKDGMSYNNAGVWNRNALYYEGISFDNCLGHPGPNGTYHHHVNPTCLYNDTDSTNHSPIIGYAFDGFPIYGAYAYTNTNGTGAIKRMKSSYVLSSATTRTNGPAVSTTYPAGCFIEDYIYTSGSGDLDEHNGRFCITPDYPSGTYAYFVTIDNNLYPAYPFVIGPKYYGVVQPGNTGPGGSHNTIPTSTTVYTGTTTGISDLNSKIIYQIAPNPTSDYIYVYMDPNSKNNITSYLYNANGQLLNTYNYWQPSLSYIIDLSTYPKGVYFLKLESDNVRLSQKIVKQ